MKVLVTAPFGNQGRQLLPKLAAAGIDVRAVEVNPAFEKNLYDLGAKEVFIGDFRRDEIMEKCLDGVDKLYLVLPNGLDNVIGSVQRMIRVAEENNIEHFVFSSCLNVVRELEQHWEKYMMESDLMGSNLNYTILKPAGYIDVHFPDLDGGIFDAGNYSPMIAESAVSSFITCNNITDVAVKVLLEGEPHYFASYDLCAPGYYKEADSTALLKKVLAEAGKELKIVPPPEMNMDMLPSHLRDILGRIMVYHTHHPYRGNPFVYTALMGKPATTLEEYFRECVEKRKS